MLTLTEEQLGSIVDGALRAANCYQHPPPGKRPRTDSQGPPKTPAVGRKIHEKPEYAVISRLEKLHPIYQSAMQLIPSLPNRDSWSFHEKDPSSRGVCYLLLSDLTGFYQWSGFAVPFRQHTKASQALQTQMVTFLKGSRLPPGLQI
jgi:hypothetical protein